MIRRGDIVVDEKPCRTLFCQSAQRGLRSLFDVSFFCCCCTQGHRKVRKSTQEAHAGLGRTPTDARIETSEAMRILNSQRGLAHAAHALHRCATDRCLRHGSGLVVHENGVEPVEFVSAACEARDPRWHPQ